MGNPTHPAPAGHQVESVVEPTFNTELLYRTVALKSGQLAAVRVGKNYRIRESDVDRYLSERFVRGEGAE